MYFNMVNDFSILQQMLADKLRCTDWEATNEAMEEAVARESYLEWLREHEKRARGARALVSVTVALYLYICTVCGVFKATY